MSTQEGERAVSPLPDQLQAVRHDLRTPVNHIIGYSEMLLEDVAAQGLEGFAPDLQNIHGAGRALLALIAGLEPLHGSARKIDLALLRHEFRTPVNHIIGYSEMLLEEALDRNAEQLIPDLQRIHDAGRTLLELVAAILANPRLDTRPASNGQATATALPDNLDSLLATAQTLLEREAVGENHHGHLLVVDDNAMNRDMLARRLARLGYKVYAVESGRQALTVVQLVAFDLILLDIMMPEIDGYQVLRELKAGSDTRHIPVIVLSALDETDSVVRCIKMGAEDHLTKPFDPVLLRARIGACLEKKRLRDQEMHYLAQVTRLMSAAADVEAGDFVAESLDDVATRDDPLGQLARVFQRMAREVAAREERLQRQVQELRIEIDEHHKAEQVAEIIETDYFASLKQKAQQLRSREASG
jgi:CheY-like chemotaxis protein